MNKEGKYLLIGIGASVTATAAYYAMKMISGTNKPLKNTMKKYKCRVDGMSDDEFSDITIMKGDESSANQEQDSEQSVPLSRINYHKQRKLREYRPESREKDLSRKRINIEQIFEQQSRDSSQDSENERFEQWQRKREMQRMFYAQIHIFDSCFFYKFH